MENKNNYCVIMAGGIGTRFWPVSSKERPKQFLDFFGIGKSLLQMTVERFRGVVPRENIIIVTNVLYRDIVMTQLPDFSADQILCEPAKRNTAPCIAYAVAHIKGLVFQKVYGREMTEGEQVDWSDERLKVRIVVAPSDHLILQEDTFRQVIADGLDYVSTNDTLLTIGITPTRPDTGYGYIQMVIGDEKVKRVKTFTEKPNLELAKVFVQSGEFVWNAGIFMWNLQTICKELNRSMPDMMKRFAEGEWMMGTAKEDAFIQAIFPTCPNISIDYGVMEKAERVNVMTADFGWSDLGTWGSIYDLSDKDEQGNVVWHGGACLNACENNIIALPKGHVAAIKGLKDYVVALSDNTLMIYPKGEEGGIDKDMVEAKKKK